jgi:hypothetical protein
MSPIRRSNRAVGLLRSWALILTPSRSKTERRAATRTGSFAVRLGVVDCGPRRAQMGHRHVPFSHAVLRRFRSAAGSFLTATV